MKAHWWVYILECADQSLYTGVCLDVNRRLRQHNGELVNGAKYTRVRRPVSLRYLESTADRRSACQREYQIKRLSRCEKLQLIANDDNQLHRFQEMKNKGSNKMSAEKVKCEK